MHSKPRILAAALALAIAVGIPTGSAVAAPRDKPAPEPSLTGAGQIFYRYSPDDDIRFSFDAHGNTIEARGTFRYSHEIDGTVYRTKAEVDCLITGGHVATVTGVITETDVPDHLGQRVGVTVEDLGRKDRLASAGASRRCRRHAAWAPRRSPTSWLATTPSSTAPSPSPNDHVKRVNACFTGRTRTVKRAFTLLT